MKVAIYSALYGGYEAPKPLPAGMSAPCYMFTDDPELEAPGWIVRYVPEPFTLDGAPRLRSPMMRAKWWKTRPEMAFGHAFDAVCWVDASMTIYPPDYAERCLAVLGDDDWAMVWHPSRDCIYEEADFSATLERYRGEDIAAQARYYREIGHPEHWGLFAGGASIRRMNDAALTVSRQWWWENATRTWQDQVSLPVLVRLAGSVLRWNAELPWAEWWGISPH